MMNPQALATTLLALQGERVELQRLLKSNRKNTTAKTAQPAYEQTRKRLYQVVEPNIRKLTDILIQQVEHCP